MPDHDYVDPYLASLYDVMNPRESSGDFAFYLPMIMTAESVLDVGCGTGSLLHWARESGHSGRLVGLDPPRACSSRPAAGTTSSGSTATCRPPPGTASSTSP
ncbi:methyltransferase domain-containing protein [Amycolatopsis sp. NPDC051371]|uniref:methyltransferase domain-containing protein n=1 Tax=Amycolatopsis sp. NPDC051371 TaxID=3155800 RepID=UPI00341E9304